MFKVGDRVRMPNNSNTKGIRRDKVGYVVANLGSRWHDVRFDGEVEPLPCVEKELEKM